MAITKHFKTESQVNGHGHTGPAVRKLKDTHHLGLFPPFTEGTLKGQSSHPKEYVSQLHTTSFVNNCPKAFLPAGKAIWR